MIEELIGEKKEVKEVKLVVIGKTYNDNTLISKSADYIDKTKIIIEHYFPYIIDRVIESINKTSIGWLPKYLDTDSISKHSDYKYELIPKFSDHKWAFSLNIIHIKSGCILMLVNMNESGNCCGSMFLHNTQITTSCLNNKDISKLLLAMQEDIAIAQKTTHLLCINVNYYSFTKKLTENYGWTKIDEFINKNGGNTCWVMSKQLPKEFKEREILGKELN